MAAAVAVATFVVLPGPTSAAPAVSYQAALGHLQLPSAKITLTAGTSYDIRHEYQQGTGNASAKLSWSTSSFGKTIVPQGVLRDR